MPDKHGFDHLGAEVRCVEEDCNARGSLWEWPADKRRRHHKAHLSQRAKDAERRRLAALAQARKLKAQAERENTRAYEEGK